MLVFLCFYQLNAQRESLKLINSSNEMTPFSTGYKNADGDTVIPIGKYRYCYTEIFDTVAFVSIMNKTGYYAIDRHENVLFEVCSYDNGPDPIKNGLYRVIINDKIGYANMQGEVVIEPKFDFALPFQNGYAVVALGGKKKVAVEYESWEGGNWGFIDTNGIIVIDTTYQGARSVKKNGEARVKKGDTWMTISIKQ